MDELLRKGIGYRSAEQAVWPPYLGLRHIQGHFGFTLPGVALTRFSGGFLRPVFKPSTDARRYSPSADNLLTRFQHGSGWFSHPEQNPCSTLRCRDYTIAFTDYKSFLSKGYCRRAISPHTTRRQLFMQRNLFYL